MDTVDAVVDYRAESRSGRHVLDVAVRSESAGVLHLQLTVSDRAGDVVGEGELRLPPEALWPAERLLGQVLRGLVSLHTVPRRVDRVPTRSPRPESRPRDGNPPGRGSSAGGSPAGSMDDPRGEPGGGSPAAARGGPGAGARGGSGGGSRSTDREPPTWSAEEHDRLRVAWESGRTVGEIARAHGRTHAAIRSRLLKLRLISLDHPESPVRDEERHQ